MKSIKLNNILLFILGMVTFAVASFIVKNFLLVELPEPRGIIEDWEQICLWQSEGSINLTISPRGCSSSSCAQIKQQIGTAKVDLQNQEIHLDARFVLLETSRFPLPCTNNCSGGGNIRFKLDPLFPNDYTVWFRDQPIGKIKIFSGRPIPSQCFENAP